MCANACKLVCNEMSALLWPNDNDIPCVKQMAKCLNIPRAGAGSGGFAKIGVDKVHGTEIRMI